MEITSTVGSVSSVTKEKSRNTKESRVTYNGIDIQISFDVFDTPREMDEDEFDESFEHIRFDNVLRYVAIRKVHVKQMAVGPRHGKKPVDKGRGRTDMGFFFNWLAKKNVRRILKVVVDDLDAPAHSDEAIEEAL